MIEPKDTFALSKLKNILKKDLERIVQIFLKEYRLKRDFVQDILYPDRIYFYADYRNQDIDYLYHPLKGEVENKTVVFGDMRPYMNRDFRVSNVLEFTFERRRSVLDLYWYTNPGVYFAIKYEVARAFAFWLTSRLKIKFGLSLDKENLSDTLGFLYYLSLFDSKIEKDYAFQHVERYLHLPKETLSTLGIGEVEMETILEVLGETTRFKYPIEKLVYLLSLFITDFRDFKDRIESGIVLLYNVTTIGALVGINSIELAKLLLEYPPLLILIHYSGYKKLPHGRGTIGKMLLYRKKVYENYFRKLDHLMGEILGINKEYRWMEKLRSEGIDYA